jgi:hypothetical protein
MPNLDFHAQNTAPFLVGVGAILSGVLEPHLIVTFLCAVLGSGVGMAFLSAPSPITSRFDLLLRLLGNIVYVLISATVAMFAMHWLRKFAPGADYPLAFFGAMIVMIFREQIIAGVKALITRKLNGV